MKSCYISRSLVEPVVDKKVKRYKRTRAINPVQTDDDESYIKPVRA